MPNATSFATSSFKMDGSIRNTDDVFVMAVSQDDEDDRRAVMTVYAVFVSDPCRLCLSAMRYVCFSSRSLSDRSVCSAGGDFTGAPSNWSDPLLPSPLQNRDTGDVDRVMARA